MKTDEAKTFKILLFIVIAVCWHLDSVNHQTIRGKVVDEITKTP